MSNDVISGAPEPGWDEATQPFACTDLGNARRFARVARGVLWWTERGWYSWDGLVWRPDTTMVDEVGRDVVAQIQQDAAKTADPKLIRWSEQTQQGNRLANMATLAKGYLYKSISEFEDPHPDWLNHAGGFYDMGLDAHYSPNQAFLFTRAAKVALPDNVPKSEAPRWEAFLKMVLPDPFVREYVHKAVGYSLSGYTSEQCLFILYGTGVNGKSTFLDILRWVMGSYACHVDTSTLIAKRDPSGATPGLAQMYNRRFVTATEFEIGQPLAEGLIKQLTGDAAVTARDLYSKSFTYVPRAKLWLASNTRPTIYGADEAIWRRIRLIPFEVVIPREKRDPLFAETLKPGASAILAWAVQGYWLWKDEGLIVPESISKATSEYRHDEAPTSLFLEQVCEMDASAVVPCRTLYDAYLEWVKGAGEDPISINMFSRRLRDLGLRRKTEHNMRCFLGVKPREREASRLG